MKIKGIFGSVGSWLSKLEKKLASKNKTMEKMAKSGMLRYFSLIVLVLVIGGVAYGFSRIGQKQIAKISLQADTVSGNFAGHRHFTTVVNGQSLNEYAAPTTEADWNFEKSHLDTVIASYHAKGLYDRSRTDAIKTHLTKYALMLTTDGFLAFNNDFNPFNAMIFPYSNSPDPVTINTATYKNMQETKDMHNFCTGTGNMPDGYARPGLSETQFEDAFIHFHDDTIVNAFYIVPDSDPNAGLRGQQITKPLLIKGFGGGTATERGESRVLHNGKYGYFYILNPKSDCARQWKSYESYTIIHDPQPAKYSDGSDNTVDPGVIYDGIFVDEANPGSIIMMNNVASGGHIAEYSNKTRDEIDSDFSLDQGEFFGSIKSQVSGKIGHDFLLTLNSAQANYASDPVHAAAALAAGGITTEMFSTEMQFEGMGREYYNFTWSDYANQRNLYFAWSQMEADSQLTGDPTYRASNYAGATGGIKLIAPQRVGPDPTGKEARHDMQSLVSYLIAKDQNNRMVYAQRAWGNDSWDLPLSAWWMKAREMDIGQPTTAKYTVPVTANDVKGQSYALYRRDYGHGVALERLYAGYPYTTDFGAQSQPYEIDPAGHTAYRILYPDGKLSTSTYTSITLAAGEGVVLVPDGYDPMPGGPPPSTTPQITMSDGGTHNVGSTFPVTVNLDTKGNTICAATLNITFPKDKIAFESATLGQTYNLDVLSKADNSNGTITYNLGTRSCSTQNDTLLTINFRAAGPGSGNIGFSSVKVVGGIDKTNVVDIPTDTTGTTFTINGAPIPAPTTNLTITNGATPNGSNWYTTTAPVFKLTAAAQAGANVTAIKYHWEDTATFTTVNSGTVDNLTAAQGVHTITFYATDDKGNSEVPKTQTFQVNTTPPIDPSIDLYNQTTYGPSILLQGTKDASVVDVFAKIFDVTNTSSKSKADLVGNAWSKTVNLSIGPENYSCTDSMGSAATCIRAKATKVELTTTNQAGAESLPKVVNITRHMLGDADGDMVVGMNDLGTIIQNWPESKPHHMSDMNFDTKCDIYDFGILVANWTEY